MVEDLRDHRDQLVQENAHLRKEVRGKFASPTLLGVSEPMQKILKQIDQITENPVTVLITGESGTGKELEQRGRGDRKSTRLNSSHVSISYAVFCLKKK